MPHAGLTSGPLPRARRRPRPGRLPLMLSVALAIATAGSINAASASINATVQVLAIRVELTLATEIARVGDKVKATATVTNDGPVRLSGVTLELRSDTAGLRVQGSGTTVVSRLQPGRTAAASWTLCALQPGNYLVLVRATLGTVSLDSQARLLTISGQRRGGCS